MEILETARQLMVINKGGGTEPTVPKETDEPARNKESMKLLSERLQWS